MSAVTRIEDRLEPLVLDALARLVDEGDYEYTTGLVPTPQGPCYHIALFLPGAVLGSKIHPCLLMPNPGSIDQVKVDMAIRQLVEGVAQARTEQVRGGNGEGLRPEDLQPDQEIPPPWIPPGSG